MKHSLPNAHRKTIRSSLTVAVSLLAFALMASPLIATDENRVPSIRTMSKNLPLKQKIKMLQRYIEVVHFCGRTIPLSMPNDGGLTGEFRAWKASDFNNQSIPRFSANKKGKPPQVTGAGWFNYENSTMFSGGYLLSQVIRLETTGDPAALVECRRAVKALQAISSLAGPERFGWMCKPWDEKLQNSTSPDQNLCAVIGLFFFLPHADAEQSDWIRKIIPAIATYWERIQYTIVFYDNVADFRKSVSHMRLYTLFNRMAYQITQDETFKSVGDRLEKEYGDLNKKSASLFDTVAKSHPGYFSEWRKCTEFAGATLLFASWQLHAQCTLFPEKKKGYLAAWQRVLQHGHFGFDPDYVGHYLHTEVIKNGDEFSWRPVKAALPTFSHEDVMSSKKWALHRYSHHIYWLEVNSRLALSYMMYLKHGGTPLPAIADAVRASMASMDFAKLHWLSDPNHNQTIPELEFIRHGMSSELGNYISAYYLGLQIGFWK